MYHRLKNWLNNCTINELHLILETKKILKKGVQYIRFMFKKHIYFCDQIDVCSQMSPWRAIKISLSNH